MFEIINTKSNKIKTALPLFFSWLSVGYVGRRLVFLRNLAAST